MIGWISIPSEYVWWIAAFTVVTTVATLGGIPIVVARLRADYFVNPEASEATWAGRHPAVRVLWHVGKNVLGVVLVLLGIVMSLPGVPGQGLLTVLIGLMLLEFPGKQRMQLWIVRRKGVRKGIGWIREKAGREPLQIPDESTADEQKKQPGD